MKQAHQPHPLRHLFHPLRPGALEPWPLDPQSPPEGQKDTHPDLLARLPESIPLEQQAQERYPYPACNQWGGVPPEYVQDCAEVDRQRAEWIRAQQDYFPCLPGSTGVATPMVPFPEQTHPEPKPNPEQTQAKPMGYHTTTTQPNGSPVSYAHVGHGPEVIRTPDAQYFERKGEEGIGRLVDLIREGYRPALTGYRLTWTQAQALRALLDMERKEDRDYYLTQVLNHTQPEGGEDAQDAQGTRPKAGGVIPTILPLPERPLSEGLIPRSVQEAIARACTEAIEAIQPIVREAKAQQEKPAARLEALSLADLWALRKLLLRRRKIHHDDRNTVETTNQQLLQVHREVERRHKNLF